MALRGAFPALFRLNCQSPPVAPLAPPWRRPSAPVLARRWCRAIRTRRTHLSPSHPMACSVS
eukprot:scaffold754_cov248-Pinguiococcus_pyrenoidosus.AAC.21